MTDAELEALRYALSHDLRFPLRVVEGYARALDEDHGAVLPDEGRGYIAAIRKGVAKLEAMVGRLDELLRLGTAPLVRAEIDVSALATSLVAQARTRYAHAVAVEIEPGLVAHADRQLVEVALAALIDNAFKFTAATVAPVLVIGRDGDALVIRDNGQGFDSNAARLFAPFRRLHSNAQLPGEGVGLALVQRVVSRHGGQLTARAQPGAGATLAFTLG